MNVNIFVPYSTHIRSLRGLNIVYVCKHNQGINVERVTKKSDMNTWHAEFFLLKKDFNQHAEFNKAKKSYFVNEVQAQKFGYI